MRQRTYTALIVLCFLLSVFHQTPAQKSQEPVLVDEFGEFTCDDLRGRLDSFLAELAANPDSIGLVVNRGDKLVQLRREGMITTHIAFRNFDKTRVSFIRTIPKGEFKTQLWKTVPGKIPVPTSDIDRDYVMASERRPRMLFIDSPSDEGSCPPIDSKKLFGRVLTANPEARGNIVVRGKTRRASYRMRSLLLYYFARTHQIKRNRIRWFIEKQAKRYDEFQPTVEYWYLP